VRQQSSRQRDCEGNLVECNHCGKRGHRAYECFSKKAGTEPANRSVAQSDRSAGRGSTRDFNNRSYGATGSRVTGTAAKPAASAATVQNGAKSTTGKLYEMGK